MIQTIQQLKDQADDIDSFIGNVDDLTDGVKEILEKVSSDLENIDECDIESIIFNVNNAIEKIDEIRNEL